MSIETWSFTVTHTTRLATQATVAAATLRARNEAIVRARDEPTQPHALIVCDDHDAPGKPGRSGLEFGFIGRDSTTRVLPG